MVKLVLPDKPPIVVELHSVERVIDSLNSSAPEWLAEGKINLKLVDDRTISALNVKYGGQTGPTDVLSFSYSEVDEMPVTEGELGDIAISYETALIQANEAETSLGEEVALLVLHGVMHICGLDHADSRGREEMQAWQTRVMTAAGIKQRAFEWK